MASPKYPRDIEGKNGKGRNGKSFKKEAKRAAYELLYPDSVIEKIDKAKSDEEITRILKDARLRGE